MSQKFDKTIFSERLYAARKEADLTQQELADELGISSSNISDYERPGHSKTPTLYNLCEIARILNVSVDWLLGTDNYKQAIDILDDFVDCFEPDIEIKEEDHKKYVSMEFKKDYGRYLLFQLTGYLSALKQIQGLGKDIDQKDELIRNLRKQVYLQYQKNLFLICKKRHNPSYPEYDKNAKISCDGCEVTNNCNKYRKKK